MVQLIVDWSVSKLSLEEGTLTKMKSVKNHLKRQFGF